MRARGALALLAVAIAVAAVVALLREASVRGPDGTDVEPSGIASSARPSTDGPAGRWVPVPGTTWQWQLSARVDTTVDAAVFDIDLFENDASVVKTLHERGRKVVCYMEAGAWEPFRPDSSRFPESILGKHQVDFPDHRWLDIRRQDQLLPIMRSRLDLCRSKGFDGVEFDDMDVYLADSGFPLTRADQLAYARVLAEEAHRRGLSAGLKNALDQVTELLPLFDFAINEECFEFGECGRLLPFIRAGKAVFNAEYALEPERFCPKAIELRFSSIRKHRGLDAWRIPCQ